ncbi:glycine-rich domain-containing protein [Methylophilus sp. QUAN]|uniref:glycine-rich domain-containing protein n=1 Tax=Methylophilus sp. QUAN TaxID=2781020 RepID=UPI00351C65FD
MPSHISKAKITIFGAGGGGAGCRYYPNYGGNGGQGGNATVYLSGISGTYTINIGVGGAPGYSANSVGQPGGTSSFSNLIYAYGGAGGNRQSNPRPADGATGGITVNSGQYIGSAQLYSPNSGVGGVGAACLTDGNPRGGVTGQDGSVIIEY